MIPVDTIAATSPEHQPPCIANQWLPLIEGVVAELAVLSRSSEEEFLLIGSRLQEFYQRGIAVSQLATEMVEEVAGEKVTGAMIDLAAILGEMERYVDRALGEIEGSSQTLREILALLDQAAGPLSGFRKVNKVLRMLGISTKIESARLGQSAAGFDTLASDVGMLSVQVNDKAALILNRKDDLARTIEQTLSEVLRAGATQHDQVVALLKKTRVSLEALSAINSRCSSSVSEVSALSNDVSTKIGEVVMSMQSHDIVRQQIEHVEQALHELGAALSAGLAGAHETASICELQKAQLQHAGVAFEAAVRTIRDSLREVAAQQSAVAAQSTRMAGIADQAGGGFFKEMGQDLSVVGDALLESWKAIRGLCEALASVAETVEEIATFVGDIETIGEEIKLIALNAQIKSAYTGDEGAALGVLAEAIQRLSVDAIDHTGSVSDVLHSIIEVTHRLTDGTAAESRGMAQEVEGMVGTLSDLLQALRCVNENLRGALGRMVDEVTQLCAQIEEVTAGITVDATVGRVIDEAVAGLAVIVGEASRLAPDRAGRVDLDSLAGRYTMQSERKVHESLLAADAAPSAAHGDDGLGENIELF